MQIATAVSYKISRRIFGGLFLFKIVTHFESAFVVLDEFLFGFGNACNHKIYEIVVIEKVGDFQESAEDYHVRSAVKTVVRRELRCGNVIRLYIGALALCRDKRAVAPYLFQSDGFVIIRGI